ncbi:microcystin-dependent protein [Xylanibacter oryzae DSM 17970]|uniref:Microcystin-dependent protein n=1 Tax=Xylanibacter oryzae DSM 17970 TaxID=915438 RepID=A0ABN0RUE2_9BACT|nr:tail fiber protein [Xylanibacter oryzae]EXG77861.1 microcystin-dependent protein [Xylanibacter oryzae DSM 17970]
MDPFLGEIRLFAGNYAPQGWHICDGSSLPISQNEALYSLIGTTYGGDSVNFNLPDLRGKVPVGKGQLLGGANYVLAAKGGTSQVQLNATNNPPHTHLLNAVQVNGTTSDPTGNKVLAKSVLKDNTVYANVKNYDTLPSGTTEPDSPLNANAIQAQGNSMPHNNMMPYTVMNYIIALEGIYPSPQ